MRDREAKVQANGVMEFDSLSSSSSLAKRMINPCAWLRPLLFATALLLAAAADAQPAPPAPGSKALPAIGQRLAARTNQLAPAQLKGPKTNPAPALKGPAVKTNAMPGLAKTGTKTNAPAGARASVGTNAPAGVVEKLRRLPESRAFYPAVAVIALGLGALLLFGALKSKKSPPAQKTGASVAPSKAHVRPVPRKTTIHACNILEVGPMARQVWQFDARGAGFALGRQQTSLEGESLPGLVKKDWRSLFQHKLNIAWLPPENVFLRVAQLPRSDFNETLSMVELQLEKLSPMPVAQVVWSFHVLPHASGPLQTVVVLIVARSVVEEFLGRLEAQGYQADRLELPLLDQLQATAITEDGAWVYPDATGGKGAALVAWWYGGVLQNLDLLSLPATNRPAALKEQLMQMAWAGELEGWLTAPPEWHLVADVGAAEWEPALREGLEQPLEVLVPVAASELAALTARRAAQADPRANLLPAEFAVRYQQQFVDRLWMRGLLAVGGVYVVGVVIYLLALGVANYRTNLVEQDVAGLAPQYTNAIQLKARYQVLKDRQDLKYAGLDCWNTTAHLLPSGVTLDRLNFSEGKRLSLSGSAPSDAAKSLLDFEAAMRKALVNNQPLFDVSAGESLVYRQQGQTLVWSLGLVLKRSEVE